MTERAPPRAQSAAADVLAAGPTAGARYLLDRIAEAEGTDERRARAHGFASGYDVTLGYKPTPRPLSQMTLDEVDAWQAQARGGTAAGRYQFLRGTLRELRAKLKLAGGERFSPELQDRLAREKMRERGYDRLDITAAQLQSRFAREWASIADVGGKSYYNQPVGMTSAAFQRHLAVARRLDGPPPIRVAGEEDETLRKPAVTLPGRVA
jgi:muramidase (phage lysozyme)